MATIITTMTIKEDYCSFELAKLLKEKGFLKSVDLRLIPNLAFYDNIGLQYNVAKWYDSLIQDKIDFVVAPTLQMAMKWLREVHNIYLNINIRVILGQWAGYDISIYTTDNDGFLNKNIPIKLKDNVSYEEAVEAGIKYVLENLI